MGSSPISQENTSSNPTLKNAWKMFAVYDYNATIQQKNSNKLQIWILVLGTVATALALSQTQFKTFFHNGTLQNNAISMAILILPITISVLIAARNQFKFGNKWILLRSGAEAIKREIYSYRTRVVNYSDKQIGQFTRDQVLSTRIEAITRQLMQTEVNLSAVHAYEENKPVPPKMYGAAASDDGYAFLDPATYIKIRIGDQISYYEKRIVQLDFRLRIFQWLIYIIGGVGTFLAAVGLQLWVALTTTLIGIFVAYLEYRQIQNTLIMYNQALTNLTNLQNWWSGLPPNDKEKPENKDKLVDSAETILNSELTGWVQQMESAMAKIYEQKPKQ